MSGFKAGLKKGIPVVLGYLPVGIAFGVIARSTGFHVLEVGLMSLLVYAGSSQFIAVAMIGDGAGSMPVILTTFLVNSRHFLMSAALAPYFRKTNPAFLSILSFGITDETFAVGSTILPVKQGEGDFREDLFTLGLHTAAYLSWLGSTLIGVMVGELFARPERVGLDFALPAMFIALLVLQLEGCIHKMVAICSGIISLIIFVNMPGNWYIIIASVLGASLGVVSERWTVN